MNSLFQTENFLIGTKANVENLSQKSVATILAVSDCHGYEILVNSILENPPQAFGEIDLFAFCGDGVDGIIDILENAKKNKKLQKNLPPVIALVQGNGDESDFYVNFNTNENSDSENKMLFFKSKKNHNNEIFVPKSVVLNVAQKNILITHGHLFGVSYGLENLAEEASAENADLILFGHTHVAEITNFKEKIFVNPGSPALPRRSLPPSFAVIKIDSTKNDLTNAIRCEFYKIESSLKNGITFKSFFPNPL